jgi:osomolarity two-component system, response regulator SKN7
VNRLQQGVKYDMILMDIIMPQLDGVSACHLIRQFDRTPIIAMTSNIRSDDIQMYFEHGKQFPAVSSTLSLTRSRHG